MGQCPTPHLVLTALRTILGWFSEQQPKGRYNLPAFGCRTSLTTWVTRDICMYSGVGVFVPRYGQWVKRHLLPRSAEEESLLTEPMPSYSRRAGGTPSRRRRSIGSPPILVDGRVSIACRLGQQRCGRNLWCDASFARFRRAVMAIAILWVARVYTSRLQPNHVPFFWEGTRACVSVFAIVVARSPHDQEFCSAAKLRRSCLLLWRYSP